MFPKTLSLSVLAGCLLAAAISSEAAPPAQNAKTKAAPLVAKSASPAQVKRELAAVQWGKPEDGLQAGLRVTSKPTSRDNAYRDDDHIALNAYIRCVAGRPVTFAYDVSFVQRPPTVFGSDGKERAVSHVMLLGIETLLISRINPGEILVVDHPGLNIGVVPKTLSSTPALEKPESGVFRIQQAIKYSLAAPGAFESGSIQGMSDYVTTILTEDGKSRTDRAVIHMWDHTMDKSLITGQVKVNVFSNRPHNN